MDDLGKDRCSLRRWHVFGAWIWDYCAFIFRFQYILYLMGFYFRLSNVLKLYLCAYRPHFLFGDNALSSFKNVGFSGYLIGVRVKGTREFWLHISPLLMKLHILNQPCWISRRLVGFIYLHYPEIGLYLCSSAYSFLWFFNFYYYDF